MAKVKIKNIISRILRVLFYFLNIFLFFLLCLFLVINIPSVKRQIAQEALSFLNTEFKTQISAERIDVDYFGNIVLHKVKIKDHHNYNFIQANEIKGYTNFFAFLKGFRNIKIDQIRLSQPEIRVITYKGEDFDNFTHFIKKFDDGKKSNKPFKMFLKATIEDGKLSIINYNLPENEQVWIDAKNLNLNASSIKINKANVDVQLDKFNFYAKRHNETYIVHQFATNFSMRKTSMKFHNLTLETDSSLLMGNLDFIFKSGSMADFVKKVVWNLDLKKGSLVSGKDIRYFVTDWNNNSAINISAQANGTLTHMVLNNPILSGNKTFIYAKSLSLKNLVKTHKEKELKFDIIGNQTSIQTSLLSLKGILPSFIHSKLPEVLNNFGTVNYKGNFSVNRQKITAKGNLVSNKIGQITTDLSLLNYSTSPQYKGWIIAKDAILSPFIKTDIIGPVSGKIAFEGKGFQLNQINTKFDANFNRLTLMGKTINPVKLNGIIHHKIFDGTISSSDANAAFDFKGKVDFSTQKIKADFDSEIHHLNFAYFGFFKEDKPLVSAKIKSNISFSTLNDIVGELSINDMIFTTPTQKIPFNKIDIKTNITDGKRNLDVFSQDMIALNLYGKYNLKDIPEMLYNGIGNLMVDYKPRHTFKNQNFSFVLDVQKNLFDLFMLKIDLSPGTTIIGNYNGNTNQLYSQLISEYIQYKNVRIENPIIYLNTENKDNQFSGNIKTIKIDSTYIYDLSINGNKRADSLFAETNFKLGKNAQSQFKLNFYQTRDKDNIVFGFKPSEININETVWTINPDFISGESVALYNVKSKEISFNKISIKSGNSSVLLSGNYKNKDDLRLDLDIFNVNLSKVIPKGILGENINIEGVANGEVLLTKKANEISPIVDFSINDVQFNNNLLGNLKLNAFFDKEKNAYVVDSNLDNEGFKNLFVGGTIKNIENGKPQLDLKIEADQMDMAPIGIFVKSIFSNFRGKATGDINVSGELDNIQYDGSIELDKAGMTVNFLGVDYEITHPQSITLSNGTFIFDNLELLDTTNKTKGSVAGFLMTHNFKDWGMDLAFNSDGIMVLNTTAKQNEMFYGKVFAAGNFYIYGPTNQLKIRANAKALPGSQLTLNPNSTATVSDVKFLKFVPDQRTKEQIAKFTPPSGLSININMEVDPQSKIIFIINEQTQDRIEARGSSENLNFNMSSSGRITMNGIYTIEGQSKYYFNTLLNKEFIIQPGSRLLWSGSPTDAEMNITASYTKSVNNVGDYLDLGPTPATDIDLLVKLTEKLSNPDIELDMQAPTASSIVKDELKNKLNNQDEIRNQAIGVLLTGKFIASNKMGASLASSAYEVFIKQALSMINNISSSVGLDVEVIQSSVIDQTSDRVKGSMDVRLSKRLSITGTASAPIDQKYASDVWMGEGKVEYDISKKADKSLIITGFSKPSNFGVENSMTNTGVNQSYGIGILYRRSFDRFSELFKAKKEDTDSLKAKKDSIQKSKKKLKTKK